MSGGRLAGDHDALRRRRDGAGRRREKGLLWMDRFGWTPGLLFSAGGEEGIGDAIFARREFEVKQGNGRQVCLLQALALAKRGCCCGIEGTPCQSD